MSTSFNFIQFNIFCCSRRNRDDRSELGTLNRDTVSSTLNSETASDTLEIYSFSDFELIQPSSTSSVHPGFSRAKLRWVKAVIAAIIRQKIVRAYNALTRLTKRNKAIGVPDPVASRLWGQTGNWLQRHKL